MTVLTKIARLAGFAHFVLQNKVRVIIIHGKEQAASFLRSVGAKSRFQVLRQISFKRGF